jgi:type II restriction enzyme
MMNAIRHDETPNFYFMQYELATWRVKNLLLVPSFAFPPSAIIKRKPLSLTARRHGWVGCNFALNRIPVEARIAIVTTILSPSPPSPTGERAGARWCESNPRSLSLSPLGRGEGMFEKVVISPAAEVREKFRRVKPLKEISVKQRGWTLDVLNAIRRLGKTEFATADAYAFTRELEKLHPNNRHVRDKIRQQLQVLRDAKLLIHVERGLWRLP